MRRSAPASWVLALLVAAATGAAFLPTLGNGFVSIDDVANFLENPHYRGLGWAQLRWMATEAHLGHYVPLAWLTLAVDYLLWGLDPRGYHLTSLLIHAGTAAALTVLARDLIIRAAPLGAGAGAAAFGGAAAALLFGLHPLRVESVAWATERRDVLSGLLFVLTVLTYVRAAATSGARRRALLLASVACHLGALLSKSIVMMAPLVLLMLDVYPLRRLGDPLRPSRRVLGRILAEKLPYLVLSGAQLVLTYRFFLRHVPDVQAPLSGTERVARVLASLWFYPVKTLVTLDLSPVYEAPPHLDLWAPSVVVAAAGVGLVTGLAALAWRWCPGIAVAWAAYVVLLMPVAGAISLGHHLTADRYSYVPCLGFAVLAGGAVAGAAHAWSRRPAHRWLGGAALAALALILVALGVTTWRQAGVWRDSLSLWAHAVTATPACSLCHVYLGDTLLAAGAATRALDHYREAFTLRPDRIATYRGIGRALEALGRRDQAIEWYGRGLARHPEALVIRAQLTAAFIADGRLDEAMTTLGAAWRFEEPQALLRTFEAAARRRPRALVARLGLVLGWLALGDRERARVEREVLRELHPGLARALAASVDGS